MSPIPIAILTPKGTIPASYTADSLADAAMKEPAGVYTVARTYERNKALLLDAHLDRLERSAQLEGISVTLDRIALRDALRALIEQSGYSESRFRITIPHELPTEPILSLEPYKPVAPEAIADGVRAITLPLERHNPTAKTTAWMTARRSAVESFPTVIYEGILISSDSALLEGTSSNFYAIKAGNLYTAPDNIVLGGIARKIVLTVAPDVLPVILESVYLGDISALAEAFITSSGRGVVPVVEIDGNRIGDGRPGSFTFKLREAYNTWAAAHLEPI